MSSSKEAKLINRKYSSFFTLSLDFIIILEIVRIDLYNVFINRKGEVFL